VLYETAAGRLPLSADTPTGLMMEHLAQPLPSPRRFRPDLSPAVERVISSVIPDSPTKMRRPAPTVRTALSYPEGRAKASTRPYLQPAVRMVLGLMAHALSHRILGMMAYARANAAMFRRQVVTFATVKRVHRDEGRVFVWTVDDPSDMRQLQAMGINGIASNRPDLSECLRSPEGAGSLPSA
jgi:glycerophosphoryl diester phosphodiesterase